MKRLKKNSTWLVAWGACLLGLTGCTSLTGKGTATDWSFPSFASDKDEEPVVPGRILAIWTDAVQHQKNQPAMRGFGGRIIFYDDKGNDPVKVDGDLSIYVFNDDEGSKSRKPERKYVIPADELQKHYSRCPLGHSYSVWLSWDQVGGYSQQFSIITRLEGRNGGTVISEPARKLLPGVPRPTPTDSDVSLAGYESFIQKSSLRNSARQNSVDSAADERRSVPEDHGMVSLASFVAEARSQIQDNDDPRYQPLERVETVDLSGPQRLSNALTVPVPTSLGMRPWNTNLPNGMTAPNGTAVPNGATVRNGATAPNEDRRQTNPDRYGPATPPAERLSTEREMDLSQGKSLRGTSSGYMPVDALTATGGVRVEEQGGATVYYGRPDSKVDSGSEFIRAAQQINYGTTENGGPGSGPQENAATLSNQLSDSLGLRDRQLQQVRDSRQQFRSEPWRFPVRTQAITRQAAAVSGY